MLKPFVIFANFFTDILVNVVFFASFFALEEESKCTHLLVFFQSSGMISTKGMIKKHPLFSLHPLKLSQCIQTLLQVGSKKIIPNVNIMVFLLLQSYLAWAF